MRIAYGMERPDAGTIQVRGATVRLDSPASAIALGIGMVHQHFTLVPVMTVAENVALGGHGALDLQQTIAELRALSERTGFALDPRERVELLPVAAQQRVEIAKALMRDARMLVLDEPTAVLPPSESIALLRWLRSFADAGNAVVLITHKLGEALSVADDVTVLRHGRTVLAVQAADTDRRGADERDARLRGGGREGAADRRRATSMRRIRRGRPIIRAERVTLVDVNGVVRVRAASFVVGAGEIVGIVGVEGAGQRELLRAVAGRLPDRLRPIGTPEHDRIRSGGSSPRCGPPRPITGRERRAPRCWGASRTRSSGTPSARAPSRSCARSTSERLDRARRCGRCRAAISRNWYSHASSPSMARTTRVRSWSRIPRAVSMSVPTAEVHDRLRAARDAGAAVVVYSSDIDEVLLLATACSSSTRGLFARRPWIATRRTADARRGGRRDR